MAAAATGSGVRKFKVDNVTEVGVKVILWDGYLLRGLFHLSLCYVIGTNRLKSKSIFASALRFTTYTVTERLVQVNSNNSRGHKRFYKTCIDV